MKYLNGEEIKLGDQVALGNDSGIVVCIIEDNQFTEDFPKSEWENLERGMLVKFQGYGLIHYIKAEDDLHLVRHNP